MHICVAGDTHGELTKLYRCVDELEAAAGVAVDAVLQVGDFGAWPDPARLDEATKRHGDSGDFARLLAQPRAPRPTYFIAGNHEDFHFLAGEGARRLPAGLTFIPWGEIVEIEARGERVRVGGVGGCYGPRDYERVFVEGARRRHYTAHDIERLVQANRAIDVLLLHEPPAGVVTELHAPPGFSCRTWDLRGQGLAELVARIAPRICFTGHIHARTERRINGVRTVGLSKVPYRGSVILVEILPEAGAPVVDRAEWGGAPDEVVDRWMTVEIDDPVEVESLARVLEAWATEVRGGVGGELELDRAARKRMHAVLATSPYRTVLMGVLLGRDPTEVVEQDIPAAQRAELLERWSAGIDLPPPATLRG